MDEERPKAFLGEIQLLELVWNGTSRLKRHGKSGVETEVALCSTVGYG